MKQKKKDTHLFSDREPGQLKTGGTVTFPGAVEF
jgi:hypothetical protein